MSEEIEEQDDNLDADPGNGLHHQEDKSIIPLSGMFKDWFLDYASYVILERAVPALMDGLKPVQRRILHSMHELEDGRYNKVANLIGNTMKYHPHGDASIWDAMVQIGQKGLLIDMRVSKYACADETAVGGKHFPAINIVVPALILMAHGDIEPV